MDQPFVSQLPPEDVRSDYTIRRFNVFIVICRSDTTPSPRTCLYSPSTCPCSPNTFSYYKIISENSFAIICLCQIVSTFTPLLIDQEPRLFLFSGPSYMGTGVNLESKLAHGNNLPFFLKRRIQFREALGEESAVSSSFSYTGTGTAKRKNEVVADKNGFREANQELFPAERIREMMQWSKVGNIGPGLSNLGNTCFLNSVLQCLTYTPPLTNYLQGREHGKKCRVEGFCLVCELERHVAKVFANGPERLRVISPNATVGHLKWIAKHMRVGRQEDSHEFLRFVIEGMQRNFLAGFDAKRLDSRVKETTVVHQIFGGYLHSRVHCLTCSHTSHTFDPLLDLSLEVRQADSINRGLQHFMKPERLAKANRYRCDHCGKLSDADKVMSIYRAPNVLTVHLKRFQLSPYGEASKINKHIEFEPELDIEAFITGPKHNGMKYELYGVLVHEGQTCNSGHYHSFVKASNGFWYSMNDSSVHQVSLGTVLKQRAYLLFYTRRIEPNKEDQPDVFVSLSTDKTVEGKRAEGKRVEGRRVDKLASDSVDKPLVKSIDKPLVKSTDKPLAAPCNLPTPPATPEPEMIKENSSAHSAHLAHSAHSTHSIHSIHPACSQDELAVISNSMWHLSSSKTPKHRDLSTKRIRSLPRSSWTIKSLVKK